MSYEESYSVGDLINKWLAKLASHSLSDWAILLSHGKELE